MGKLVTWGAKKATESDRVTAVVVKRAALGKTELIEIESPGTGPVVGELISSDVVRMRRREKRLHFDSVGLVPWGARGN